MTPTTAIHRLRLVLATNAAFSVVGGVIALAAGSWVSRELGIDHVALTRLLGAGLVVFGIDVALAARTTEQRLLPAALAVSAADAAWVIGTVIVVAAGVLSTTGVIVAVVIGLAVADFGTAQAWLRAKATQPTAGYGQARERVAVSN
ncbi:MAG: hypothetical protein R8F63_18185 [Acidimicrobiales bacterium]|nr:hypothetical protein [Acidimicrobiales bacterium]